MPLERRRRLVELAQHWGVIVLEDAVYSDLRYSGDPIPSLLSLDDSGLVIQSHSFSKNFVPGIRIGWMTGHHDMIAGMAAVRQDLGVSQWMSRIMAEYLRRGRLDPHIAEANQVYRRKRDVAAAAVRRTASRGSASRCPMAASTCGSSFQTTSIGSRPGSTR